MKCPHCLHNFHEHWDAAPLPYSGRLAQTVDPQWVRSTQCPGCGRLVVEVCFYKNPSPGVPVPLVGSTFRMVWPKGTGRPPLPPEVPDPYATDYREASLVVHDSPKASAALSRRCLQLIIREKAGITKPDLAKEIQELINSKAVPTYVAEALDHIRNVGNFAAHPLKVQATGEIVEVEPGEAEYSLDVLDMLFDHYFVQPSAAAAKKAALNAKLAAMGKPPMK